MPSTTRLVAPALVAALVLAARVDAQRTSARGADPDTVPPAPWERRAPVRFALGAGGLYQLSRDGAGTRVADGGGFDAFGALQISALSLGIGYQRSGRRLPSAGAGRVTYDGVFVEPRLSVAPYRNFTPYLAGRVTFLRQRVPASAQYRADSRSLTALGAGIGTLVWLAPSVQLDLAGLYTEVRGSARAESAANMFTGGTGSGAVLRAGLVFGLENWGR